MFLTKKSLVWVANNEQCDSNNLYCNVQWTSFIPWFTWFDTMDNNTKVEKLEKEIKDLKKEVDSKNLNKAINEAYWIEIQWNKIK